LSRGDGAACWATEKPSKLLPKFHNNHPTRYAHFQANSSTRRLEGADGEGAAKPLVPMPADLKHDLDLAGAMEVYMDARPFSALTSEYMQRYLEKFASISGYKYTPPY
jgi:hypothetical protein